jgi:hypothetical protein
MCMHTSANKNAVLGGRKIIVSKSWQAITRSRRSGCQRDPLISRVADRAFPLCIPQILRFSDSQILALQRASAFCAWGTSNLRPIRLRCSSSSFGQIVASVIIVTTTTVCTSVYPSNTAPVPPYWPHCCTCSRTYNNTTFSSANSLAQISPPPLPPSFRIPRSDPG